MTSLKKLGNLPSNNSKTKRAARRFSEYGKQIRELVEERQQLNIKIENVNREKFRMEEGDQSLESLLSSQDSVLSFLDQETDWDPKKVKNQMEGFQILIKNHKDRFRRAPIGPLFSHVEIKNSVWCKLVEKILTGYLCTFVVDNAEDEIILHGLAALFKGPLNRLEQMGETPLEIHIMVVPFSQKFNPLPKPRIMDKLNFACSNLLETLKFKVEEESHIWKIAVGKQINAENIFLFLTEHDAFIFMYSQASVPVHKKVLAYSLDGYQIFPFPEFKTAAIKIPKRMSFFPLDRSEDIAFLEATANELEEGRKLYDEAIKNLRELQMAALYDWDEKNQDPNNNDVKQENFENSSMMRFRHSLLQPSVGKYTSTPL